MPWDPAVYERFQAEREAPFDDLVALIERREGMRVIDLGCGTGELTSRLAERLPGSDVLGVDSSGQMLAKAMPRGRDGVRFEQRRIEDVAGTYDLVFSHAALQWVDGHEALIPRLFEMLAPGGQLAVQVPSNHNHISHVLIRETASEPPFRDVLGGFVRHAPVLSIDEYARLLFDAGAEGVTVFEKVYPHVLEDAEAIVTWVRGTALVPYLERLGAHADAFLARYTDRLRAVFPASPVFYPFRRTLFAARRI